ncbi:unnamed protein product [Heterobilharzia americana]|nr:unnamed protein product [Heterobilharzia americana]
MDVRKIWQQNHYECNSTMKTPKPCLVRSWLGSYLNKTITCPEETWFHVQFCVKAVLKTVADSERVFKKSQWISAVSSELMDVLKASLVGFEYNKEQAQLKSRLRKSLRNDREQWWQRRLKRWKRQRGLVTVDSYSDLLRKLGEKGQL